MMIAYIVLTINLTLWYYNALNVFCAAYPWDPVCLSYSILSEICTQISNVIAKYGYTSKCHRSEIYSITAFSTSQMHSITPSLLFSNGFHSFWSLTKNISQIFTSSSFSPLVSDNEIIAISRSPYVPNNFRRSGFILHPMIFSYP